MSETPATRNRTRRRVVRQAGPPVEDDHVRIEVLETSVAAVSPEPAVAAQPKADAVEPKADTVETVEEVAPVAAESATAEPEFVVAVIEDAPDSDVEETAESEGGEPKSRFQRARAALGLSGSIAAVVALISTLVLIGSGGVYLYHQPRADDLSARRQEYIQVAKQAYLDMVTVKADTAGPDLDRLFAVAGGGLKDDLAANKEDYKKVFEQMKVQSSGKIISAAIESDGPDSAKVLLLAQQTVSNAASNGPMQKDYRFRVTVNRHDGTVTASAWELVP
ncbi:hypothetical protein GPX89_18820 [Nocardia sp. ET3-3]|uniref:Mce-associated membrane protein n=1 Tax=Nocardia terrae TaxID=2675851 RepID=A0A7K1UY40_9NOCA|nr:hypothetical protein [Nocardia terrae]MVU79284.1 hypothetical protein [Nocardia terrae]